MNLWSTLASQVADRITTVGDAGPAYPRQRIPRKGSEFRDLFVSDIDGVMTLRGWVVAPGGPLGSMEPMSLGNSPHFEETLGFRLRGFSAIDEELDSYTDFLDIVRTVQFSVGLWRGWTTSDGATVRVSDCRIETYSPSRFGDATVWAATISLTLKIIHQLTYEGAPA